MKITGRKNLRYKILNRFFSEYKNKPIGRVTKVRHTPKEIIAEVELNMNNVTFGPLLDGLDVASGAGRGAPGGSGGDMQNSGGGGFVPSFDFTQITAPPFSNIKGSAEFTVHPNCKMMIDEMMGYSYRKEDHMKFLIIYEDEYGDDAFEICDSKCEAEKFIKDELDGEKDVTVYAIAAEYSVKTAGVELVEKK